MFTSSLCRPALQSNGPSRLPGVALASLSSTRSRAGTCFGAAISHANPESVRTAMLPRRCSRGFGLSALIPSRGIELSEARAPRRLDAAGQILKKSLQGLGITVVVILKVAETALKMIASLAPAIASVCKAIIDVSKRLVDSLADLFKGDLFKGNELASFIQVVPKAIAVASLVVDKALDLSVFVATKAIGFGAAVPQLRREVLQRGVGVELDSEGVPKVVAALFKSMDECVATVVDCAQTMTNMCNDITRFGNDAQQRLEDAVGEVMRCAVDPASMPLDMLTLHGSGSSFDSERLG